MPHRRVIGLQTLLLCMLATVGPTFSADLALVLSLKRSSLSSRGMAGRSASHPTRQARWQLLKERQDVAALQLTAEEYLAFRVDAVDLKKPTSLCRDRSL